MKAWLSALVVLASVSILWADVGPKRPLPAPAPPVKDDGSVPMVIETTNNAGPSRLIIPKKFVGAMKASLDQEKDTGVASSGSRTSMILGGVFLTLSMAFSGLWVIRQRSVFGNRTVAIMLGSLFVMGVGAAIVLANGPPPPIARPADNGDKVVIEIVEQGDSVKLIVPKARLARLGGPIGVPVPLPAPVPQPAPGVKPAPAPGAAAPVAPPKPVID